MDPDFERNAATYDRLAPQYDAHMRRKTSDALARSAFVDLVAQHVTPGSTLLDFGCGTGMDALDYVRRGYRVQAYDHSPGMIAQLENRCQSQSLRETLRPVPWITRLSCVAFRSGLDRKPLSPTLP